MAAAADGFAVSVEHHQLHVREATGAQHVGELEPQPLDRDGGDGLTEVPAGIGESGLDAQASTLAHIGGDRKSVVEGQGEGGSGGGMWGGEEDAVDSIGI